MPGLGFSRGSYYIYKPFLQGLYGIREDEAC